MNCSPPDSAFHRDDDESCGCGTCMRRRAQLQREAWQESEAERRAELGIAPWQRKPIYPTEP
jgi:hypothetical protein